MRTLRPTVPRTPRVWWLLWLLVVPIAVYALRYAIVGERAFIPDLRASFSTRPRSIFLHTLAGSVVLLGGLLQFHRGIRTRWSQFHRWMGRLYVLGALGTGGAGLYLAAYSGHGWVTHVGFGLLALGVLFTTSMAYVHARRRDFRTHSRWMLRSYALIFAAVTLRIELPLLSVLFNDFVPAYKIVSWLSWVPNAMWAEWYLRRPKTVAAAERVALPA